MDGKTAGEDAAHRRRTRQHGDGRENRDGYPSAEGGQGLVLVLKRSLNSLWAAWASFSPASGA